ncbi:MAG: hypothetical protein QM484_03865 [Woeseiaceae bacterium]
MIKHLIFIILVSMSFSGCTLIYSYSDDLPNKINLWVKEKDYKTALETIEHIQPKHKYYKRVQRQKKSILEQVKKYKISAIETSHTLVKNGEWIKAIELLNTVEGNVVNAKKIIHQRNKILSERTKAISHYENTVLNGQALYLLKKMPLYNKINKTVYKAEENQLDIKKFDIFRQETSLRLAKRSQRQYKKEEFDTALTTINLALKLIPNSEVTEKLNHLKSEITQATKKRKSAYVKETKSLISKLSQGYSHTILRETKEKIIWLTKIKANEQVYPALISQLQKHFSAGIKQNFEAARKLYSEGKTQEALSIWLELQKFEPEHPRLQAHIERAEKVLIKLKELSNKPAKNK